MEPDEMRRHRFPLDDATADRLAAGRLDPADAPPGYAPVARLLADAHQHELVTEVDERLLGDLVLAITAPPTTDDRTSSMRTLLTAKVGALAAGALLATAGVAAAATGNLPDPAQEAMADVAERVGIDLPTPDDDEVVEPVPGEDDGTGEDTEAGEDEGSGEDDGTSGGDGVTGNVDNPTDADAHGVEVSDVARTTEATGRDKGAEVSETARAGHGPSDDGTDEDEGDEDGQGKPDDPGSQAPVDHPGGADAAGGAGGGAGGGPGTAARPAGTRAP
jgi:hypothetical protein